MKLAARWLRQTTATNMNRLMSIAVHANIQVTPETRIFLHYAKPVKKIFAWSFSNLVLLFSTHRAIRQRVTRGAHLIGAFVEYSKTHCRATSVGT